MSATFAMLVGSLHEPEISSRHHIFANATDEWQDDAPSVFSLPLLAGSLLSIVCFLAQLGEQRTFPCVQRAVVSSIHLAHFAASFCCVKSSRRHPATMIMYMGCAQHWLIGNA